MKNIPCEVIEDLLPLYADKVASKESVRLVEEHIAGCEKCREKLKRMQSPEPAVSEEDSHAIDFLKKNRQRNRRTLIGSLIAAAVLIASVFGIRFWLVGSPLTAGSIAYDISVSEDDHRVIADIAVTDSLHVIRDVVFAEEDGVVTINVQGVNYGIYHGDTFHQEYKASAPVRQVRLNDTIVWDQGERIFAPAPDVFAAAHPYVGDMSANIAAANALGLSARFGPFKNELITDKEPYRWRILLEEDIPIADEYWKEADMRRCACILIGVTGNLSEVEFVFTADGEDRSVLVTKKEADSVLGQDVKNCMTDIRLLNRLISLSGISESVRTWSCDQFTFDYPSFCSLTEVRRESPAPEDPEARKWWEAQQKYLAGDWLLRDEEKGISIEFYALRKNTENENEPYYGWTLEDLENTHKHFSYGNVQNDFTHPFTFRYRIADDTDISFASIPNTEKGVPFSNVYEVIRVVDRGDTYWDIRAVVPVADLGSVQRWLNSLRSVRFLP